MDRTPKPGEFYRHFKDHLYQVITVARHTETGEQLVIYQALYGDFGVFARPLSMFLSRVDREKYPDARQDHRFQLVTAEALSGRTASDGWAAESEERLGKPDDAGEGLPKEEAAPPQALHPLVGEFLDQETYEGRLEVLVHMRGKIGRTEVDSLCFCLGLNTSEGTVDQQLDAVIRYLRMQKKYDGDHLR